MPIAVIKSNHNPVYAIAKKIAIFVRCYLMKVISKHSAVSRQPSAVSRQPSAVSRQLILFKSTDCAT
ncbi:MAG: hypothetical protein F6K26_09200 [Moorea sp. SIO2I5]|nr:hypothetical protein [Moorena sp. SIO2I5]